MGERGKGRGERGEGKREVAHSKIGNIIESKVKKINENQFNANHFYNIKKKRKADKKKKKKKKK